MLVLTRSHTKDSAMTIGDFVTISVVEWGRSVRLAFLTTKPINIRREEVVDRQPIDLKMGNLVLTRREGEAVIIGENIRVEVLSTKPSSCKIGIDAPREMPIVRAEAKVPEELEEI